MTDPHLKFPNLVTVNASTYTNRNNHLPGEGGALNAGYTPVDALCKVSNILGSHGLRYGEDWWWDGFGHGGYSTYKGAEYTINLRFAQEEHRLLIDLGSYMHED